MSIRDRIVELRRVAARDLAPDERNWRRHPERQRRALRAMLEDIGYAGALLAREEPDGRLVLIDGHLRAEVTPDTEVPVLVLDVDAAEAGRLLATLDPLAGMAQADQSALRRLLEEAAIPDADFASYLDRLAGEAPAREGRTDPDDTPADVPARAKPGDLWILGDHRVLCGDATSEADLERLMAGERAAMIFTDPPYGEGIVARSLGVTKGKHSPIENDDLARDGLAGMLLAAFKQAHRHSLPDAAFYVWHAATTAIDFAWAMTSAALQIHEVIIWVKPVPPISWADYQWAHEPCFYASKAGERAAFHGPRTEATVWRVGLGGAGAHATSLGPGLIVSDGKGAELYLTARAPRAKRIRHLRLDGAPLFVTADDEGTTVWEVARDTATPEHPTQKPVELARRAIANSSRRGEIVLDQFLGSGSTLIGAEMTTRRCFGTELDPHYVDVIVARWERFTGHSAVKEEPQWASEAPSRVRRASSSSTGRAGRAASTRTSPSRASPARRRARPRT